MENVQKVIEKFEKKVYESYPSMYSKDDVVHLLHLLSEEIHTLPNVKPLLDIDIEEFKEDVIDRVEKIIDNFDFEDNVELEIRSGREIDVSFDSSSLVDEIRDDISEFFDKSELQKWVTPKVYEE
jgi:predicted RNA-binding protein Jag